MNQNWLFEVPARSARAGEYYGAATEYEFEVAGRPASRRTRFFQCSDVDRSRIENLLQMSIPVESLRSAVDTSAGQAVTFAQNAARALETIPRTRSTRDFFCETFGVPPEFVPTWRPARARWRDLGGLVAIRLRDAAKILDGGWIRYFCWGSSTHCPECPASPPTYFACSSFKGKYVICLGQGFWQAWQNRDTETLALTLLHEALHIYFGRTVEHDRFTGNAFCYERFVVRTNGLTLPGITNTRCPARTCT